MVSKAAPRKAHRERAQPAARAGLGLLEKKKDYLVRAKDYKEKRSRIKKMKEKAAFRNQDEFYFAMINQRTKNGVHLKEHRTKKFSVEEQALLKTQDLGYVNYQLSINRKKLERLQSAKHIVEENEESIMVDNGKSDSDSEHEKNSSPGRIPEVPLKPAHTIFVESSSEGVKFISESCFLIEALSIQQTASTLFSTLERLRSY
ncbi:U3 small nucleolar RNA-associated protein 11 [Entophlyctis luteolus]|nr:U3 small nucleolar RNA-associated protein 11 [Entophlyctis luteolus]